MTGLEFLMSARAFAGERTQAPLASLTLARRIVNREPIDGPTADRPFVASEWVYAHTTIAGHGAGFIEHVWTRDGVELARHYMPVGDDRCWRTWSRHRVAPGRTTVEVFGPDGRRLDSATFTVSRPSPRDPKENR
ncbi:MAG TPA: DUF2914 domain-containing protein [Polyangia bacterium]|nr:DUF2914 domain-containing protein [Polyangia bacterium]